MRTANRETRRLIGACHDRLRRRSGPHGRRRHDPCRRTGAGSPAARQQRRARARRSRCAQTTISPMPMLNVRNISSSAIAPARLQQLEERRHRPRAAIDRRGAPVGQHARQVVGDAAAGDVRHALDRARRRAAAGPPAGTSGAAQQRLADGRAELRHDGRRRQAGDARTARGAPASSRWCAGRTTAGRSARRPARSCRPSTICGRSTTPTMKPARSYSPSA